MNRKNIFLLGLLLVVLLTGSCEQEEIDTGLLTGLWVQTGITEDQQELVLSEKETNLRLLIEGNGVYRTHTTDGISPVEYYGAWSVTDGQWIEFSIDEWLPENDPLSLSANDQWSKNHVLTRFTLLHLDKNTLQIRIKTYHGYRKYSPMFVEHARPLITEENYPQISNEFKEIKTYVFTFSRQQ